MSTLHAWVAYLAQATLDVIAALLGTYYSKKYAAIARRLGLPRMASSPRRGFIVIQIDGLSHPHLLSALDLGYAPYLQRLLRRGEYLLRRWNTGLPCTTPAVQAGIMFGNNDDIPAFRWYDKATGEPVLCKLPKTAKAIQDRVSAGRPGILTGGSSFMNMFDGDASLSMFTLGAWNRKRFFESVRGMGFFLLFALNPFRSFNTLALAIWEYLTDLVQRTSAFLRRRNPRPLERNFPFLRVMANVVFREIQTFAVMVDVYRGMPAIYTTYYGYDELAHHYGPLAKPTLRALHAIDARIRQIDLLRRLALTREYDLYILSDHGITSAVPFKLEYGQTLGELIRDLVGGAALLNEPSSAEQRESPQEMFLADELAAIEANIRPPLSYTVRKTRKLVIDRIRQNHEEILDWDPLRRTDIVVRNSGSLAHIYFNALSKQMDLSEITALYAHLVSDLAAHPGIWLVIGREGDQVIVMSREGVLSLDGGYHVEGNDPLRLMPDPKLAAAQLARLARFPHSGDLILMGSYNPEKQQVSCFEDLWACHGGLGGPQESAMMIVDSAIHWDLGQVKQAADIYPFFARRYPIESNSK